MKIPTDAKEKLNAAYELLQGPILSYGTFHHIHTLVKGLHPEVDKKLEIASKAFIVLQKLQEGDVITLSTEHLPETTESQKKRKKALLFFITHIKDLQNEIKRVSAEMSQPSNSASDTAWHVGRIIKYAKGPVGLITIAALIIVGVALLLHKSQPKTDQTVHPTGKSIQVITYKGKQIPLTQFFI